MNKNRPAFSAIIISVLVVIVLPIASITAFAYFVKDRFIFAIVLGFMWLLLLLVLPLLLLATGAIRPALWTKTYLGLLNRVFPRSNLDQEKLRDLKTLEPISDLRIQARDWKLLHEELQNISLKIVILRGMISGDLLAFETNWGYDCSRLISAFCQMETLPNGDVRNEFTRVERDNRWFAHIEETRSKLDQILRDCDSSQKFEASSKTVSEIFQRMNLIIEQVLQFIDKKLQHAINSLDQEIESSRNRIIAGETKEE